VCYKSDFLLHVPAYLRRADGSRCHFVSHTTLFHSTLNFVPSQTLLKIVGPRSSGLRIAASDCNNEFSTFAINLREILTNLANVKAVLCVGCCDTIHK
jgi:hypothetical protein